MLTKILPACVFASTRNVVSFGLAMRMFEPLIVPGGVMRISLSLKILLMFETPRPMMMFAASSTLSMASSSETLSMLSSPSVLAADFSVGSALRATIARPGG